MISSIPTTFFVLYDCVTCDYDICYVSIILCDLCDYHTLYLSPKNKEEKENQNSNNQNRNIKEKENK